MWGALRSTSENTTTGEIPMARQVFAMRTAISPRFAIRSFRIGKQSLYVRLPASLLQYCFQYQLRTRTDPQIVRQVFPADDPAGVDKKFRRTRDVVPVRSALRMQNAVAANHFRRRIGQERIR